MSLNTRERAHSFSRREERSARLVVFSRAPSLSTRGFASAVARADPAGAASASTSSGVRERASARARERRTRRRGGDVSPSTAPRLFSIFSCRVSPFLYFFFSPVLVVVASILQMCFSDIPKAARDRKYRGGPISDADRSPGARKVLLTNESVNFDASRRRHCDWHEIKSP